LSDDAHGLVQGVHERVTVDRDGLALQLVRPTGIVAEAGYAERDIAESQRVRLPGNQRPTPPRGASS